MSQPAIKGSAFHAVHADVRRLLEEGRLARARLEAELPAEDLRLLERKVLAGSWYPLESHRRLLELLRDVEGGGSTGYLVRRGERAAERLVEAGIYAQLRRAERRGEEIQRGGEGWRLEDTLRVLSLAGAMYSVGRWRAYRDPATDLVRIEVSEAAALPEVTRWTAQGFIQFLARHVRGGLRAVRVTSERPEPDRILFTVHA